MRIEESCIIDAARMFIQKHPCIARPSIGEFTHFLDVLVKRIPTSALFCITLTDANIAGHAPDTFWPTPVSLRAAHINIGRAFEDILALAKVLSQFRKLIICQEKNVSVVSRRTPIKPSYNPRRRL